MAGLGVRSADRRRAGDATHVARWFHALADATRLRIIERLCPGEQCVCDLTDALEAGQSRLSFHLKTLKDAGIVRDRRQGRWIYYSLNPATFRALEKLVSSLKGPRRRLRLVSECCDGRGMNGRNTNGRTRSDGRRHERP